MQMNRGFAQGKLRNGAPPRDGKSQVHRRRQAGLEEQHTAEDPLRKALDAQALDFRPPLHRGVPSFNTVSSFHPSTTYSDGFATLKNLENLESKTSHLWENQDGHRSHNPTRCH